MEPDVEHRFDGVDQRLDRLETLFAETRTEMAKMEARLTERMRDMQTGILKAFLPWQDTVRIQFRELEANTGNSVQAVKLRVDVLERRLGEIEKKLLLEPPAA